jgi:hypothetical protein
MMTKPLLAAVARHEWWWLEVVNNAGKFVPAVLKTSSQVRIRAHSSC